MATMRSGGAVRLTSVPQLDKEIGYDDGAPASAVVVASGVAVVLGSAAGLVAAEHPASPVNAETRSRQRAGVRDRFIGPRIFGGAAEGSMVQIQTGATGHTRPVICAER